MSGFVPVLIKQILLTFFFDTNERNFHCREKHKYTPRFCWLQTKEHGFQGKFPCQSKLLPACLRHKPVLLLPIFYKTHDLTWVGWKFGGCHPRLDWRLGTCRAKNSDVACILWQSDCLICLIGKKTNPPPWADRFLTSEAWGVRIGPFMS
jgi:hypothetical protein